MFIDCLNSTI